MNVNVKLKEGLGMGRLCQTIGMVSNKVDSFNKLGRDAFETFSPDYAKVEFDSVRFVLHVSGLTKKEVDRLVTLILESDGIENFSVDLTT